MGSLQEATGGPNEAAERDNGSSNGTGSNGAGSNGTGSNGTGRRGAKVPNLPRNRQQVIQKSRNPLRRLLIILKRVSPLLIILAAAGLLAINTAILNAFLLGMQFIVQLVFGILTMIIQFAAIFWFMSRSRVERIRPEDPKVITFEDYWGQPNLKKLVRQWLGLLSDREQFVRMGGRYINGLLLYGEPGPARPCWPRPWRGRPAWLSSPSRDRGSATCSGAWTP